MAFTDGRKIHVKNLSYEVEEDDLRDAFSKFGTILEVKIIRDHLTSKSRGFGFVTFQEGKAARAALEYMDNKPFRGAYRMRVNWATQDGRFGANRPREHNDVRERRSLISGPPPGMGFRPDSPLSRRERALQNAKSLSPPFVGDQQPPGFQSSQEKAEDKARTDAASPAPSADRTCRSKSPPPKRRRTRSPERPPSDIQRARSHSRSRSPSRGRRGRSASTARSRSRSGSGSPPPTRRSATPRSNDKRQSASPEEVRSPPKKRNFESVEDTDEETKEELKAALDIALDKQIELEDKIMKLQERLRMSELEKGDILRRNSLLESELDDTRSRHSGQQLLLMKMRMAMGRVRQAEDMKRASENEVQELFRIADAEFRCQDPGL